MHFQDNWTNLISRREALKSGKLNADIKVEFPLTETFQTWAKVNWSAIQVKFNSPELGVEHTPFSEQDYANFSMRAQAIKHVDGEITGIWDWDAEGKQLVRQDCHEQITYAENLTEAPAIVHRMRKLFPVSQELLDSVKPEPVMTGEYLAKIDERLAEWNPRARSFDAIMRQNDAIAENEHADLIGLEYTIIPEIIGGIENEQAYGLNEYGDVIYSDFDADGMFMPMGNPENSADTRDDLDMSDPDVYREQDWQDIDRMDDLNVDYQYSEVAVTERPVIVETAIETKDGIIAKDEIVWETESSPDANAPVESTDDIDWVEDARNWLTRGRLIEIAADDDEIAKVLNNYPVSSQFMRYLDQNEIDWKVANERLSELTGLRKTAAQDLQMFGAEVPTFEAPPDEYLESQAHLEIADIPFE